MALHGDDCRWFFTSHCRKGASCQYRHCEEARGSDVVCPSWLEGSCYDVQCPYRHAHLDNSSQPWQEFYPVVPPVVVAPPPRSSLVSVPIVGGEPSYERYDIPHAYYPDQPIYEAPAYASTPPYGAPPPHLAPDERRPSQASVIITPRHEQELFPPQVKPVVVHLGADGESSDSDDSAAGRSNLTTIRRIETSDMVDSTVDDETPGRVVVEKEKLDEETVHALHTDLPDSQSTAEQHSDDEGTVENEGSGEEEEEEEVEEEAEEAEEAASDAEKSDASGSEDSSDSASTQSPSPDQTTEQTDEPVLDIHDEDDTSILGMVERAPAPVGKDRRSGGKRESREQRQQRREKRREERRLSPSGRRDRRLERPGRPERPANRPREPRAPVERKKSPEKPAAKTDDKPVEVLSLEEIMRQKALQSMIERRKQKELAEKAKAGETTEKESGSPKRPEVRDRPDPRDARDQRDRPYSRPGDWYSSTAPERPPRGRSRSRSRSPPRALSQPEPRWRQNRRRDPPFYDDRWRRYQRDEPRFADRQRSPPPPPAQDARQTVLQTARAEIMKQLASDTISAKDMKRIKKQLKRLEKLNEVLNTDSGSESSDGSSSDGSSTNDERRKRRKHKTKKSKRKKSRRSRRRTPASDEEIDAENQSPGEEIEIEDDDEEEEEVEIDSSPVRIESPVKPALRSEVIAPPKVIPRAKVVIKLDDDSKELNISGSDLLVPPPEEKVIPPRKIQLKNRIGKTAVVEDTKGAIAGRLAAKKADDEAAKLMLQKIRDTAMRDTRRIVGLGAARKSAPSPETISAESEPKSAAFSRLGPVDAKKTEDAPTDSTESGDASKRRIIRRQQIYVPPSAKRKADGDSMDSTDVRAKLNALREDKPQRPLTPELRLASNGTDAPSTARRATLADVRAPLAHADAPAAAKSGTKFDVGVKTFAEIMAEKRERKAREMEEKRKGGAPATVTGKTSEPSGETTNKPATKPSVLDRLAMPKESSARVLKSAATEQSRTLQRYEDDWLEDSGRTLKEGLKEGLLRENKRRSDDRPNSREGLKLKRARTEPSIPAAPAVKRPVESKSQDTVLGKRPVSTVRPRRTEELALDEDLLLSDEPLLDEVPKETAKPTVQATKAQPEIVTPELKVEEIKKPVKIQATSSRKSDSHSELDELDQLLLDVDSKPGDHAGGMDDDSLLLELDELLA